MLIIIIKVKQQEDKGKVRSPAPSFENKEITAS